MRAYACVVSCLQCVRWSCKTPLAAACWAPEPERRPTIEQVSRLLDEMPEGEPPPGPERRAGNLALHSSLLDVLTVTIGGGRG